MCYYKHSGLSLLLLRSWLGQSEFESCWGDGELSHIASFPRMAIKALNQEPTLELHSRAEPSVEEHHHVNDPNTGRNSGGRRIIITIYVCRADRLLLVKCYDIKMVKLPGASLVETPPCSKPTKKTSTSTAQNLQLCGKDSSLD